MTTVAEVAEDVSTWKRIDLSEVVDGTFKALSPSVMQRTDGHHLLYRGMVHSFHGESESGKSMVIQAEVAEMLKSCNRVLYIDFESDRKTVVNRLLQLGVLEDNVVKYLYYVNPDTNPLTPDTEDNEHWERLLNRRFHLAVIDGVTEAFSVFGVSSMDNDAVTRWGREVPRRIASRTGAAVVVIDHVNKDRESRNRFAMGAQAKMSYLTGASYVVEVMEPIGVGMLGRISLRIAKDRPGEVRPRSGSYRNGDRTQLTAIAVIDSTEAGRISYSLEPFTDAPSAGPKTVTDDLMRCIIEHLLSEATLAAEDPRRKPVSQRSIVAAVRERGEWSMDLVKKAIQQCATEKLIRISTREKQGKASTFEVTPVGKRFAVENREAE